MLKVNIKRWKPEPFIALVLALAPLLQHYKGLYENSGRLRQILQLLHYTIYHTACQ